MIASAMHFAALSMMMADPFDKAPHNRLGALLHRSAAGVQQALRPPWPKMDELATLRDDHGPAQARKALLEEHQHHVQSRPYHFRPGAHASGARRPMTATSPHAAAGRGRSRQKGGALGRAAAAACTSALQAGIAAADPGWACSQRLRLFRRRRATTRGTARRTPWQAWAPRSCARGCCRRGRGCWCGRQTATGRGPPPTARGLAGALSTPAAPPRLPQPRIQTESRPTTPPSWACRTSWRAQRRPAG